MTSEWTRIQKIVRANEKIRGPKEALLNEMSLKALTDVGLSAVATLSLKSKLSVAMFERLLLPDLKAAFEAHTGKPTSFEVEVASRQESFPLEEMAPELFEGVETRGGQQVSSIRFRDRLTLDPALTFETFIETSDNRFVASATKEFSDFSPLGFAVLSLHGPSGVGKSHLLHSAGARAKAVQAGLKVKIVTGDEFITDFQAAIVKRDMPGFRHRYRMETDMLLIDDLHSLSRAKATQEEFFNLMNHLASTGRRLLITSDRAIATLEGLEERIVSRLQGGLVLPMSHPSELCRREILARKLLARGIQIEEAMLAELTRKAGPCVRSLEGVVNTLNMLSRANSLNSNSVAKLVFGMPTPSKKALPLELMENVASMHGLTLEQLRGKSRARAYVSARRESMKRLKEELGLSLAEIGRLHHRDHSTVVNALR